jgi:hypothetical protein
MAIDFGNYAQLYGGQPAGFDQLTKGISSAIEGGKERREMQAVRLDDKIWNDVIMSPFSKAAYGSVENWSGMPFNMNAGRAFSMYKSEALKNPKLYNIMANKGFMNPLTFKQKYDEMASQYSPLINRKLEFFADERGWTDRELQKYISDSGNPGLQDFLMDHSQPGTLAYEAGKQYKHIGLFGGAVESATGPASMALIGPGGGAAVGLGREAYKKGFKGVTKAGLASAAARGANPFKTGLTPAFQKLDQKGLADLAKKVNKGDFAKGSKASMLRRAQRLQAESGTVTRAVKRAQKANKGKDIANLTKEKFKVGSKTMTGKELMKYQTKLTGVAKKAEQQIAKAPLRTLQRYVRKKGTVSLVKLLGKHMGKGAAMKMAAKLAAGTMLTATGVGAGVGMAMNLWTLIDIARVAANALKETGGLQRPDRMLFGE